jgi:hypothetical protein
LFLDKAVHVVHKAVLVHKVQQERVHKVCKVLMDQWVLEVVLKVLQVHKEQLVARAHLVFKAPQVLEHRD